MKRRYILYRRKRGGIFYIEDTETRKQESTGTRNRAEATALLNARNESFRQPQLNLQIAKAYLAGTDSGVSKRTWQDAFNAITENKHGSTQERWQRAVKQKAFDLILPLIIIETQAEQLFACLKAGTVSTNVHLRELHNFCIGMNWLAWPIIPKRLWPKIEYKPKRAIRADEHQRIIEREPNPENRSFYELCWHLGGSQTDVANLEAASIDWNDRVISYARRKTGSRASIHFGPALETILRSLPTQGLLFPRLALLKEKYRGQEFRRRCAGLGIFGVTLQSKSKSTADVPPQPNAWLIRPGTLPNPFLVTLPVAPNLASGLAKAGRCWRLNQPSVCHGRSRTRKPVAPAGFRVFFGNTRTTSSPALHTGGVISGTNMTKNS